jgi:benzodiazapine receptor
MSKSDLIKLILSILICQAAGFIGSIFTSRSIPTWYASLKRPAFAPPNRVFAPVWTTLFVLMGISLYLVWRMLSSGQKVSTALILFASQLVLNMLWTALFFGLKSPFAAFIEIVVLWIAILLTIIVFFRASSIAAVLLIPYILWVSFAAVLNFFFWKLNP